MARQYSVGVAWASYQARCRAPADRLPLHLVGRVEGADVPKASVDVPQNQGGCAGCAQFQEQGQKAVLQAQPQNGGVYQLQKD